MQGVSIAGSRVAVQASPSILPKATIRVEPTRGVSARHTRYPEFLDVLLLCMFVRVMLALKICIECFSFGSHIITFCKSKGTPEILDIVIVLALQVHEFEFLSYHVMVVVSICCLSRLLIVML